jgi:hypothetical protein
MALCMRARCFHTALGPATAPALGERNLDDEATPPGHGDRQRRHGLQQGFDGDRTEMTGGGGEAGDSATGGAIVGSGGGSTSGAGANGVERRPATGGAGTGGGAVGGAGGTAETGGEGGERRDGRRRRRRRNHRRHERLGDGGAGGMVATGGAGGAGGDAETAGGEGRVATGGAGGAVGASGSPAGGTVATGGAAGDAAGGGGPGGEGGAASTGSPVRGQVIDFWGHPLPNVPVEVSGSALTITDEHGRFEVPDVPAVYDASLISRSPSPREVYGWVYQWRTRRGPTLQRLSRLAQWDATTTSRRGLGGTATTRRLC